MVMAIGFSRPVALFMCEWRKTRMIRGTSHAQRGFWILNTPVAQPEFECRSTSSLDPDGVRRCAFWALRSGIKAALRMHGGQIRKALPVWGGDLGPDAASWEAELPALLK